MEKNLIFTYADNIKTFQSHLKISQVKIVYNYKLCLTLETQNLLKKNLHNPSVTKALKFTRKIQILQSHPQQKAILEKFTNCKQLLLKQNKQSRFRLLRTLNTNVHVLTFVRWRTLPKHITKLSLSYEKELITPRNTLQEFKNIHYFKLLQDLKLQFFVDNSQAKIPLNILKASRRYLNYFKPKLTTIYIDTVLIWNNDILKFWTETVRQYQSMDTLHISYLLEPNKECEQRLLLIAKTLASIRSLKNIFIKVRQIKKEKNCSAILKEAISIIEKNVTLSAIELALDCHYTEDLFLELAKAIKNLPNVSSLKIVLFAACTGLERGLKTFSSQVLKCPFLEIKLDISNLNSTSFDSQELSTFFQNILQSKSLERFNIITPKNISIPFICDSRNDISFKGISSKKIQEITLFFQLSYNIQIAVLYLSNLRNLTVLDFDINFAGKMILKEPEAKTLFQELKKLQFLTAFRFKANNLEQEVNRRILKYLKSFDGLDEFYLDILPCPKISYLDKYGTILFSKNKMKNLLLNFHPTPQIADSVRSMVKIIKKNSSLELFKYSTTLYDTVKRENFELIINEKDLFQKRSSSIFPFYSATHWF